MPARSFERTAGGSQEFTGGTEFDESLRPNHESGDSTNPESGQESGAEYEGVEPGQESAAIAILLVER